jgi:hypothetical protein
MKPCASTTPSLLGWQPGGAHFLHLRPPLQVQLILSSFLYTARVTPMAPQLPPQVNLITLLWQMAHYALSSALRVLLLAPALHSRFDLLFCSKHPPLASHTCCTPYLPLHDSPCNHFMPRTRGHSLMLMFMPLL